MNAEVYTHDVTHHVGEYATHPIELCLQALDGVANPRDTHGISAVYALPVPANTAHSGAFNCPI